MMLHKIKGYNKVFPADRKKPRLLKNGVMPHQDKDENL